MLPATAHHPHRRQPLSAALRPDLRGPIIDFTPFCKLKNHIQRETWKKANDRLAQAAVDGQLIDGDQLRLDTTAVETDIH